MATTSAPDDPDGLRSLDAAFELPEVVSDPKLRTLYEVLVARMRDEAKDLPMTTVQLLLIERIAFNYVVLRSKERGELGGFAHSSVQKDYNTFWLAMTDQFNKLLGKTSEPLGAADRKALLKDVQKIVAATLAEVPDPRLRAQLLQAMAAKFEAVGI